MMELTKIILENYQNKKISKKQFIEKLKEEGWSDIEIGYLIEEGETK